MIVRMIGIVCAIGIGIGIVAADNFEVYSGRKGCESIVKDRERGECDAVQRKKNEACNINASCDLDKHKRQIDELKELQEKLKTINDSDRSNMESRIRDLRAQLDSRKAGAADVMKIAQACIDARAAVQDWFKNVAISTTERARDEAMRLRRDLLQKLKDADERRARAKEKRDANQNDSSARDEYERAATAYRDVEKELEAFNNKYGKDIERHADRLISHYREERDRHDEPTKQAENRLQKCKELQGLSY